MWIALLCCCARLVEAKSALGLTNPYTEAALDGICGEHDLHFGCLGGQVCELTLQAIPQLRKQGGPTCTAGMNVFQGHVARLKLATYEFNHGDLRWLLDCDLLQ